MYSRDKLIRCEQHQETTQFANGRVLIRRAAKLAELAETLVARSCYDRQTFSRGISETRSETRTGANPWAR